jgi:hypothetical protein
MNIGGFPLLQAKTFQLQRWLQARQLNRREIFNIASDVVCFLSIYSPLSEVCNFGQLCLQTASATTLQII